MVATLTEQLANAGVLYQQGQLAQAHDAYLAIVRTDPKNLSALGRLAALQTQLGRHRDAVATLHTLCALAPSDPVPASALGVALRACDAREEAKAAFRRAVDLDPGAAQPMNDLCDLWIEDDDLHAASTLLQSIVAGHPENVSAQYKLGYVHLLAGDLAAAAEHLTHVAKAQPDYAPTFLNLGSIASWNNEPRKAEAYFRQALALQPGYPEALDNLGRVLLAQGKYREGWTAVESYTLAAAAERPFPNVPLWDGTSNAKTLLLVYLEEGLGDGIQFARYLRLARRRVGRLLLLIDGYWRPLRRLLETLDGVDEVLDASSGRVKVSKACSLLSLPYLLGLDAPDPEPRTPYLAPPAADVAKWAQRLGQTSQLRVGLVWAGHPRPWQRMASMIDRRRSVSFDTFRPLLNVSDVQFVSLQLDERGAAKAPVVDFTSELHDMADTAALIAQLDLVISVDTSVAHLAGAMATPVWLLNRFDSCWRWGTDGETTPWYPTMRIFRQTRFGDWSPVVAQIATQLAALRDARTLSDWRTPTDRASFGPLQT